MKRRTMKRRRNVRKMKQLGGGISDFFGNIQKRLFGDKSGEQNVTFTPPMEDVEGTPVRSNQVVPTSYGGKLRRTRKRH